MNEIQEDEHLISSLLSGSKQALDKFQARVSRRFYSKAIELCQIDCQEKSFCKLRYAGKKMERMLASSKISCDGFYDALLYVMEYFYNPSNASGRLFHYQAKAPLDAYIAAILYDRNGYLKKGWLRHKRRIRLEDERLPKEIKDLPQIERKVYKSMASHYSENFIASSLNLSRDKVKKIKSKIYELLMKAGLIHLVTRLREHSLDDYSIKSASTTASEEENILEKLDNALKTAAKQLHEREKLVLRLYFEKGWTAAKISTYSRLPEGALLRSGEKVQVDTREIYWMIEKAMVKVFSYLKKKHRKLIDGLEEKASQKLIKQSEKVRCVKALFDYFGFQLREYNNE
jgi:DNA-directed RNA polymerase specialized sigma24 family protein